MPRWSRAHSIRQIGSLLQSKRVCPTTVVLALFFLIPVAALAQGSPFDTGFTAIQSLFTGTIAKVASLVAIVIGGYGFAHGEPGAKKALAGLPHVSLCVVGLANESAPRSNGGGELHLSCTGHANSERALTVVAFRSQCANENFALKRARRFVSRLCSGTASGLFMRPAAARSSASTSSPCRLRFPSKSCSERAPKRFLRSLRKCRASALGSMANLLNGAPIKIGKFNERRQSCIRTK